MFDRKLIKKVAKKELQGTLLKTLGITILLIIINVLLGIDTNHNIEIEKNFALTEFSYTPSWVSILVFLIQALFIKASAQFYLFYKPNIQRGVMTSFFEGFNNFIKTIFTAFICLVSISLWSILFIIPGIIKAFSLSQVFYILADNPKISIFKALKMSKELTRGYKGEIFLLGLSFIGWFILSLLTCGIALLWIFPYCNLTFAKTYLFLKHRALKTGALSKEDFLQENT